MIPRNRNENEGSFGENGPGSAASSLNPRLAGCLTSGDGRRFQRRDSAEWLGHFDWQLPWFPGTKERERERERSQTLALTSICKTGEKEARKLASCNVKTPHTSKRRYTLSRFLYPSFVASKLDKCHRQAKRRSPQENPLHYPVSIFRSWPLSKAWNVAKRNHVGDINAGFDTVCFTGEFLTGLHSTL